MAEIIELDTDDEVEFQENAKPIDNLDNSSIHYSKRAKRDNVLGPWKPCRLLNKVENIGNDKDYVVQFVYDNSKRDVASYELANGNIPDPNGLEKGTRVIAARRSEELPYKLDDSGQRIGLYGNNSNELYAGIFVDFDEKGRCLVFFDDGMVQYVPLGLIRRVLGNDGHQHAHWNAKSYFEFYLNKPQWELKLSDANKVLKVELNGKFTEAKIEKTEGSLALIHFENVKRFEWIYLGSPRISNIYRQHIKKKSFDNEIEYKTYQTCLSANDEITVIDLLEPTSGPTSSNQRKSRRTKNVLNIQSDINGNDNVSVKHKCRPACLRSNVCKNERNVKTEAYTALQRPMMVGWARLADEHIFYRAPCGIKIRGYTDLDEYLTKTMSNLRIDCFEFSNDFEIPPLSTEIMEGNDISRGKEKISISVRDQTISLDFKYITAYSFDYIDVEPENNLGRIGCDCDDNCRDKLKCSCWKLTVQLAIQRTLTGRKLNRYSGIGYTNMKLIKMIPTGIVECGVECKCCADKCANHVVQNGTQHKLEVFMTENKGWGVRATTDLPEGAFICNYTGDVLEEAAADQRDSKYQFKLPKIMNSNGDGETDFDSSIDSESDDSLEPKNPRNDDVLQPFLNYLPPMQNGNADYFPDPIYIESNKEMKMFVIDALKNGNVARFINHSCDPNLFCQMIFASDDKRFPLIAFFANRSIKANEEITINYMYEQIGEKRVECHCGAANCHKRLI